MPKWRSCRRTAQARQARRPLLRRPVPWNPPENRERTLFLFCSESQGRDIIDAVPVSFFATFLCTFGQNVCVRNGRSTMRVIFACAVVVAVCATRPSVAWAGWACGAISGENTIGRSWGAATEEIARKYALQYCASGGHHGCRIISCSANVDTQDQAHKIWPGNVTGCFGKGPCQVGR